MLENEMAVNAENLKGIVEQGNKLARAGHFDSAGILKAVQDFDKRWTTKIFSTIWRYIGFMSFT